MSQSNSKWFSEPTSLSKAGSISNQNRKQNRDRGSAKDRNKGAVLIPLSKKRKRYAIEYQNKRIGIIKPGIDHWCAIADLQYGAAESKLDSPMLAVNWLVDNYKRVELAGIRFFASQNLMHYNIECEDWLIKIDLTPYDCLAKINHENNLDFEYFPDLNSAVAFSFDLILNQDRSL